MNTQNSLVKKHNNMTLWKNTLMYVFCQMISCMVVALTLALWTTGCASQPQNITTTTLAPTPPTPPTAPATREKLDLIILEDMPDLGAIKLDKMLGTDYDGQKFFLQRYTTLQRRIRDALLAQAEANGFVIHLLEDNPLYSKYKSKNSTLVGVYFDPTINNFQYEKKLLNDIKANNPDTLVLMYRIDALMFLPDVMEYRITLSLNLKDLRSNVTRPVGTLSSKMHASSTNQEIVMDELAMLADNVVNELTARKNGGATLKKVAVDMKNSATMPKEPITLHVNGTTFDPAVCKRVLYQLRSFLIKEGLTTRDRISSSDTTMTAEILEDKCQDSEELYFEYISPFLESINLPLDDTKIHYNNRNILTIQLDMESESTQPTFAKTDDKKTRVAVLYFENNTGSDANAPLSKGLCDMMINDMAQSNEIEIVERARLEEILKELNMGEDGIFDQSRCAEIGKLLGAQFLVFGSYFQMMSKFRIDARIVRVETGKICVSSGEMGTADDFDVIEQKVVNNLLKKLFPDSASETNADATTAKVSAATVITYGQALSLIDKGELNAAKVILQQLVNDNPGYVEAERELQKLR